MICTNPQLLNHAVSSKSPWPTICRISYHCPASHMIAGFKAQHELTCQGSGGAANAGDGGRCSALVLHRPETAATAACRVQLGWRHGRPLAAGPHATPCTFWHRVWGAIRARDLTLTCEVAQHTNIELPVADAVVWPEATAAVVFAAERSGCRGGCCMCGACSDPGPLNPAGLNTPKMRRLSLLAILMFQGRADVPVQAQH